MNISPNGNKKIILFAYKYTVASTEMLNAKQKNGCFHSWQNVVHMKGKSYCKACSSSPRLVNLKAFFSVRKFHKSEALNGTMHAFYCVTYKFLEKKKRTHTHPSTQFRFFASYFWIDIIALSFCIQWHNHMLHVQTLQAHFKPNLSLFRLLVDLWKWNV